MNQQKQRDPALWILTVREVEDESHKVDYMWESGKVGEERKADLLDTEDTPEEAEDISKGVDEAIHAEEAQGDLAKAEEHQIDPWRVRSTDE